MDFPKVKLLLFVSLVVTGVIESECQFNRWIKVDPSSEEVQSLAKNAIAKFNIDTVNTQCPLRMNKVVNAWTEAENGSNYKLVMGICQIPCGENASSEQEQCKNCSMLIVYERVNDIQINGFLCSVETTKKRSLSLQPQPADWTIVDPTSEELTFFANRAISSLAGDCDHGPFITKIYSCKQQITDCIKYELQMKVCFPPICIHKKIWVWDWSTTLRK